jgi:hypothetical protein
MSISEYIVPWTSEWLANYELWKVTGRWASPEAPHDVSPLNLSTFTVEDRGFIDVGRSATALPPGQLAQLAGETALVNFPYFAAQRHLGELDQSLALRRDNSSRKAPAVDEQHSRPLERMPHLLNLRR